MSARVLICDDDALVRAGLSLILGGEVDLEVVGDAPDGRAAIERISEGDIDLVLMDLRMPVLDGIEATREIVGASARNGLESRRSGPGNPQATQPGNSQATETKVIVLTTFDADDYVVRALAAGAHGFLLKDTPPEQIIAAIRAVLSGEPALSPQVTRRLIDQVTEPGPEESRLARASELVASLTEREQQVALAIAQGASNAEIAGGLHLSLATVKAHISHIFSKLDAVNRVQVAIAMHDAGLL